MIRNSLMLNDTGMLLLHQLAEWRDESLAFHDILRGLKIAPFSKEWHAEFKQWHAANQRPQQNSRTREAMMREIWLIWQHPDVPLIRSLAWHFVIEGELFAALDGFLPLLVPSRSYESQRWGDDYVNEEFKFIQVLVVTYTQALSERAGGLSIWEHPG